LQSFEKRKEKMVPQIEACKQSLRKRRVPRQEANPEPLTWMEDLEPIP